MSATQLAAWGVALGVAGALAALTAYLLWATPPAERVRFNLAAAFVAALALAVIGVGGVLAAPPSPPSEGPAPAYVGRCGPGLYDNGGERYDGPVCVPWPTTGGVR